MKRLLILLCIFIALAAGCSSEASNPEEVWGELEAAEGEREWDTLSAEQQELVDYPEFDEDNVYWTPNGKSYHSIEWCYTLEKSKEVINGTLDEAFDEGKDDPCSKCVGD